MFRGVFCVFDVKFSCQIARIWLILEEIISMDTDSQTVNTLTSLGDRLRLEREQRGLSASLFAQRIRVSRPTLREMERGSAGVHIGHWVRAFAALGRTSELQGLLAPTPNLIEQLREQERKASRGRRSVKR